MLKNLVTKAYFEDRLLTVMSAVSLFLGLVNIFNVGLRVEQFNFKISTQFYNTDLELGEWWDLYRFLIFALLSTIVGLLLSFRLFLQNRGLSVVVLAMHQILMVLLFVVSSAVLGISPNA